MRVLIMTGFYPGQRMGGAEYQCSLIANGLQQRGHTVGFLGTNAGEENSKEVNGVQVWELRGWRTVGEQRHREEMRRVIDAFRPDVVYVRLMTELVDVMAICRPLNIPVVSVSCSPKETGPILWGEHPREFLGHLRSGMTWRHYRSFQAVKEAVVHVSNSKQLTESIRRHYPNKRLLTIYNGSPCPPEGEAHTQPSGQVIWVNNLRRIKRPALYIKLAAALPTYRFVMIGAAYGRWGEQLRRMMDKMPNLDYLGAQPLDVVNAQITESDLLIYTSGKGKEGSANSFLQAWFRGVPTVSTFEMDYIPTRENIGRVSDSFDDLVRDVRELMEDDEERLAMGRRAYAYARRAFRVETMVDNYEELFAEIVSNGAKS